jgi:2'-5' RNA ligase
MKSARFTFGCLMGTVDVKNWTKLGTDFIEEKDVYGTQESGFGLEDKPHVTLLFGFHDDEPDIAERLENSLPIKGSIKGKIVGISIFETPDYDVVKFDVESPALFKLNKWCKDNFEYTSAHKDYHPHVTIAYVKKGMGKKYKRTMSKSFEFDITELVYSHPDKEQKKEKWSIA